ncbi:SDR family oxidoreductase [Pleionea mediterranea]|jgi:3-oxoacyl-[acyl-carrier protein] reductase|uniref:3-oxoacyl-[acyl-carrier protein] reductase n=1 Tax=Pleionea mediterranea TaxID=523701 RepID=A0A316FE04_9GAMM|nr:SDR family oxidoreductase [Pleionea mediterranea]PWK45394.1 3-oxoacyl-[acyl-carrier protein] reductase [Pleionea mediterranea]
MMNLELTGKKALVCGSSQGIGKAIALQLAKQGASVTLFSRNQQKLEAVKNELDTSKGQTHDVLVADFSDTEQVKSVLDDHLSAGQQYSILINNTGGPAPGPAHQADAEAFLAAFNQHLINNQNITQRLLEGMKQSGSGRIINVISTSVKQPLPNLGVSNTVRGAVANWAKTIANELGPFNITVNNVLPGATNTVRLESIISNKAKKLNKSIEEVTEMEKSIIPLRRFGEAEEFANAVGFLASPAGAYITGVNLPVDGGRTGSL